MFCLNMLIVVYSELNLRNFVSQKKFSHFEFWEKKVKLKFLKKNYFFPEYRIASSVKKVLVSEGMIKLQKPWVGMRIKMDDNHEKTQSIYYLSIVEVNSKDLSPWEILVLSICLKKNFL